jgi:hypothetical protein
MRMLECKKLEHKPTMKKLADVTPKKKDEVVRIMGSEPREIIKELIVPALARNIMEIKALKKRVGYLEIEVLMLTVALVATAICAAL